MLRDSIPTRTATAVPFGIVRPAIVRTLDVVFAPCGFVLSVPERTH